MDLKDGMISLRPLNRLGHNSVLYYKIELPTKNPNGIIKLAGT